ncbi:GNAT family N-acetyltransferase [Chitinophaga arvensicola]|uniref:Protein N-acetyltransferase, RimJ/RimL family n=1 Tax=Chitinophaga arvensicola TaxID=29529 RepID=A0A1I0QEB5_9BACT|nr:GNAT family N-acetyltransferase [Chitinophaga arvensicola]SEW25159.1 Protein N-acetyltransferase, RimJ/RimL family [Chitinophaga arvensicola]
MKIFTSTPQLILRELIPADAAGMFELDSDEAVHLYLGNNPVKTIAESSAVIEMIRQQYKDNGIGRWAVIEKETNHFVGWAGLKLIKEPVNGHVNYYDVGYRFIKRYWGKGYATECAIASLAYGFNELKADQLFAMTDAGNAASRRVLEKVGFMQNGTFYEDGILHNWFEISKDKWLLSHS